LFSSQRDNLKTYRVAYVSPDTLAEAAEGAFHTPGGLTVEGVARYLKASDRYAANVIISGVQLKILEQDGNIIKVTPDGTDLAKAAKDQRGVAFKKLLVRFDPFIVFAMLVMKKNQLEDAARKVKVIYKIPDSENNILTAFRSWGIFAEVIVRSESGEYVIGITEERLSEQYLKDLVQAVQSEFTARLFVSSKVREHAYSYLGDEEVDWFVGALMKFGTESEDAVRELGNAFETFLRRLGTDQKVPNISKTNGIGELASSLKSAQNRLGTGSIILEQHKKLCEGVGVYRNAADHGIDKVTLKPWRIEKDAALEAILLCLTTVRSVFTFVEKGDQLI
jgi:hypothetical protein